MAAASTRLYQQVQNNHEALVMAHLAMVKRIALHLKARLPPFMELDELVQVGMIGLLEAARAYDADKGIDFENFAHSRVRGAILDEVRRLSFLPRSAVAINKSHAEALHVLAAELGRTPPSPNWPISWARRSTCSRRRGRRPSASRPIPSRLSPTR